MGLALSSTTPMQKKPVAVAFLSNLEKQIQRLFKERELKKPTEIFDEWLEEVRSSGHPEPTAMVLATVDKKNQPSARMVLLKKHHQGEFYFSPITTV